MAEQDQKKIDTLTDERLLKSALFGVLRAEYGGAAEDDERVAEVWDSPSALRNPGMRDGTDSADEMPQFSEAFGQRIAELIAHADEIIEADRADAAQRNGEAKKAGRAPGEAVLEPHEERRMAEKSRVIPAERLAEKRAEKYAENERAEAARMEQEARNRTAGKTDAGKRHAEKRRFFGKYSRSLIQAASLLLVFGLGVFVWNETGIFVPNRSGSMRATMAAAPANFDAAMPEAAAYDAAGSGEEEMTAPYTDDDEEAAPRLGNAPVPEASFREQAISESAGGAAGIAAYSDTLSDDAEYAQESSADAEAAESKAANGSAVQGTSQQIANPILEVADAAAIEEQLGIRMAVDAVQKKNLRYEIIAGSIGQITYESERLGTEVTFRAADASQGDISGVYEAFDESRTQTEAVQVQNQDGTKTRAELTVRFAKDSLSGPSGALASWSADGVNYSMWAEDASCGADLIKEEAKALFTFNADKAEIGT